MFQEFPKALYLGGDAEAAYVIVADVDCEEVAREDGYASVGEEVVAPASRTALMATAEAKGIKVDKRWSDARLTSEIAKAP
jgi:hypothetical protein